MTSRPVYLTTPIYYVNGRPHIGHAYTTTVADALARWHRLQGRAVVFLTGTDEHGQKVLEKARERGMSPQAHVDDMVGHWQAMMTRLQITHDRFIRTTDADHIACVQACLAWLKDRTDDDGRPLVYQDRYVGWYSKSAERFWTEKDLVDGVCPDTGQPVERVEEVNWFFRMSSFQLRLIDHIEAHPEFISPESRRNEILGFLRQPLGDLSISRPHARLPWGIPLPFDPDSVTYVWFDALLNYVSATGWRPGEPPPEPWAWPAHIQLLGKDILTTHAVYWTTMLMALDLPLPRQLLAHGWWLDGEGRKMSKSLGNVVDPDKILEAFGLDAFRWFMLREVQLGSDGRFGYDAFLQTTNADLANDLGNLAHRGMTMTEKWLGGAVPPLGAGTGFEEALQERAQALAREACDAWDTARPHAALEAIVSLARAGNKYLDDAKPWSLNKAGDAERAGTVLRTTLEVAHLATALALPVLVDKGPELLAKLSANPDSASSHLTAWREGRAPALEALTAGAPLTSGEPTFPRHRELPDGLVPPPPSAEPPPSLSPPIKPEVTFEQFGALDLRAGRVVGAQPHPNADRLLVLQVDIGEARPRQIVAGIASRFDPDALIDRTVVIVANLKPAKLRGQLSEGMVLAAGEREIVDLLAVQAPPGTVVR